MKRVFLILLSIGLMAASCGREPAGPEVPAASEGGRMLVLTAYAPVQAGDGEDKVPATKVSVATTGKVSWTAGDEIALYNSSGQKFKATLTAGEGTSQGTFTCTSFSGTPGSTAVYPYSLAGDSPGTVTIPYIQERSNGTPALMASAFQMDGSQTASLYFKHIAPVIDITLHDIPAYARALVLSAGGLCISGSFSFDTAGPGPIKSDSIASSQIITFHSGEGYGTDLHFRMAVPPGDYSDLHIAIIDGDEVPIEGLERIAFGKASLSLQPADYLAMPALDIRSKCTRSSAVRKVEGTWWAAGNLIADGKTSEGFQSGWRLGSQQYEFLGCDQVGTSGTGVTITQSSSAFDRFNWGGIAGDAWKADAGYMLPSDAKFSISGRIFSASQGSGEELEASELSGEDCFAVPAGGSFATGSQIHGDVAFWASKGQYRIPTAAEISVLRAGSSSSNASGKAGYVNVNGNRIYG
ncbi:MAG: hypothetical protein IKH11_09190, partial [Bacteroidales bacterium]|nr:hypothetical protein [Bacteroidales bacterium]